MKKISAGRFKIMGNISRKDLLMVWANDIKVGYGKYRSKNRYYRSWMCYISKMFN